MEKKRILYLDALKGLCMFIVIDGHIMTGNGFDTYSSLSQMLLYSFGLPVFFFISGFLAYKKSLTLKDFWDNLSKKFIYLMIPTLVFVFAGNLLEHENPLGLFTLGFRGYWFPLVLMECFLIYYLCVLLIKNDTLRIIVLLILSVGGFMLTSVSKNLGPAFFDVHRLSKLFQFFAVGLAAKKYRDKYEMLMQNEAVKAVSLLTFFVTLFLMTYDMNPTLYHFLRDEVMRYAGAIAVVSLFACNEPLFTKDNKIVTFLNYVGRNSFSIFFLHYFFLPHLHLPKEIVENADMTTVHVVSLLYALAVMGMCAVFIMLLSNSKFFRKYAFGQK
jgi:fucose 4-O-acetylase-like acetyltransferase